MISKNILDALNGQLNLEFHSAYLYLSMATYFDSINLKGCARWMRAQFDEEVEHGMRVYEYLAERGGRIVLQAIETPQSEWKSPLDAFEQTYQHECEVTKQINKLVNLATSEQDNATVVYLQPFVKEQVKEEAHTNDIVQKLKRIGDNSASLLMLDQELAKRKAS